MTDNKWQQFKGKGTYRLQDLGRPAMFLIPVKKLKRKIGKVSVEERLHKFLVAHFTAYTSSSIPSFGVWKGSDEKMVRDESRQYKVSFEGKDRLPVLIEELARIATLVEEECIYFEAGQYACLIYPE